MALPLLYTACVLGAIGMYLLVRHGAKSRGRDRTLRALGALAGIGAFGWLLTGASQSLGGGGAPSGFFLLASALAIVSAVQMVTHPTPVYSALYFVLVVLASAVLFLLLEAEFMAFALVIVYAGAILITYMFVLMLAQQAPDPENPAGQPEYDLRPREPAAGAAVGFILIALLGKVILEGTDSIPPPPSGIEASRAAWEEAAAMPARLEESAAEVFGEPVELALALGKPRLDVAADGSATVWVRAREAAENAQPIAVALPADARPDNVQTVGLALIRRFPVSLELAGVILLLAMFGAVILARRQIELTEDDTRAAAGMPRLGHHDEPEEQILPARTQGGGAA